MRTHSLSVPVVDLQLASNDTTDVARQIETAMKISGFFYLRGHQIPQHLILSTVQQLKSFFYADNAIKQQISINQHNRGYLARGEAKMYGAARHDVKEVFFFGRELAPTDPDLLAGVALCAPNQWPQSLPGFRTTVLEYLAATCIAANTLLEGIAIYLGLPADFFKPYYKRPLSRGQLIHYPAPDPAPTGAAESAQGGAETDEFGVAPHTDFGCVTLLYQHSPGLEVLATDDTWLKVPPQDGALVVNIGDLLERWTRGRMPSTTHRVRNLTGVSRYSIAIFYDPSPTAIIDPNDINAQQPLDGSQEKFAPVSASDYIIGRSRRVFAQFDASLKDGT